MLIKALGNNILAFLKKHFLPYLVKQAPVEENGVTLVLDEGVDRQADRPYLYNRVFDAAGIGGIEHSATQISLTGVYDNYNYSPTGKLFNSDGCTLMFLVKHQSGQSAWYMKGVSNSWLEEFRYFSGDDKIRVKANGTGVHTIDQVCDFDYSKYHLMSITINFVDGEIKVYKDTELLGSVTASTPNSSNAYTYMDYIMKSNVSFFYGKLKSYSQYYSVKSQSQITDIVNGKDDINNLCFRYVLEEGSGSKVYPQYLSPLVSVDDKHFFVLDINTSDITSNRIIDNDAPLLPNSGDVVGFSDVDYGYFNQNANNVASADVSDLEIDDFVLCFYFRKDGSDGVTQGICGIQAQTRATLGQSGYFIQTNTSNSLVIVFRKIGGGTETIPIGTVLQSKKWNHVVIYKNGTDLNYSLNGVSGNPTLTFSEIDWTSTSKLTSFGGYATNTFSFTEGQVSVTQFQLGEYSTANVNAALAQETLPSLIADIPFSDGSGTTLTNNEGTNLAITVDDIEDFWKKQYSPSNGVTDVIFNRPLTHTGRKDFPLTPYQEPAYKGTSTDYATMSQYEFLAEEEYIIEWLQLNYTNASTGTILGNQASDNFIIGLNSNSWYVRLNDTPYQVDTTLDLSDVSNFRVKYKLHNFTGTSSSITAFDIEAYIYDLDGNELASDTSSGELCGGTIINMMFASNTTTPTRFITGNIPWIKFYVDDVLTNHWEYLGNNSLIIWDRVGGNHATITTSNITANQGTQDVYSSRLKDGYSQTSTLIDSNVWSFHSLISSNRIHNLNGENLYFDQNHSGAGFANWDVTYENNYLNLAPDHVTTAIETFYLFLSGNIPTTYFIVGVRYKVTVTIYMPPSNNWDRAYFDIDADWSDYYRATTYFFPNSNEQTMEIEFVPGNSNIPQNDVQIRVRCQSGYDPNVDLPMEIRNWKLEIMNEDIPANLLNNGLDIFGNTLTHPAGTYLHSDIKLTSPVFRTLDTALESNEELYRDTTDANGNAVKDRLLIPVSYGKSDKGFPAYKGNGVDEIIDLDTQVVHSAGNSYKIRALIIDYETVGGGYATIMGANGSDDFRLVLYGDDKLHIRLGGSSYTETTTLSFSTLSENGFIYEFYFNHQVLNSPTDAYVRLYDLNGNVLWDWQIGNIAASNLDQPTALGSTLCGARNSTNNIVHELKATVPWIQHYTNNTLTHWWQYTGNNSFLVQEVVGDNHGTITTANIVNNQGEQNVFNALVDGFSLGVDATYPTVKLLPQYPYNGLDIFDNTLTTPRSKERTKSLKYTDND